MYWSINMTMWTAAWTRVLCVRAGLGWAGASLAFLSKTQRILVHCEISISSCCRLCCMHKPFCCQQGYCQTLTAIEKVWIFRINIYWLHSTLYRLDQTQMQLPLQTYHGTQHSQHTEVKLILYNCVLAGLAGVWFLTFYYWSCSLTLPELCTNITVSEGFYANCRI